MSIPQTSICLFLENAPTTGYAKGCRCDRCKTAKSNKAKIHYLKHKDHIDNRVITNTNQKSDYYKNYRSEYYRKNVDKIKQKSKIFRKKNKINRNLNHKNRIKEDPWYALQHNLRGRLRLAFVNKNLKKTKKTLDILGCSIDYLKTHLEANFKEGMNWNNYGRNGWVVDHIIPLNFAKNDINKLYELCNYKNLQPLWESENCSKADKIIS